MVEDCVIAKCLFSLFFISFICILTPLLLKFGFHSFSLLFLLHIQFYKREAVNITYAYNELRNAASGVCLYARTSYKCSKCVCFSWWAWGYAYGFHILMCVCFSWWAWGYAYGFHILIVIWTSFAHPILLITDKKGGVGGILHEPPLRFQEMTLPWNYWKIALKPLRLVRKLIEKSFHSDAITYLSRIVQKMIPTQTNFTLNYD